MNEIIKLQLVVLCSISFRFLHRIFPFILLHFAMNDFVLIQAKGVIRNEICRADRGFILIRSTIPGSVHRASLLYPFHNPA